MTQPRTTSQATTPGRAAAATFLASIPPMPQAAARTAQADLYAYESGVSTDHDLAHGQFYGHALHLIGDLPAWYALNDLITTHLRRILGGLDWLARVELAAPLRDATLAAAATSAGLPRAEADVLSRAWDTACAPHLRNCAAA